MIQKLLSTNQMNALVLQTQVDPNFLNTKFGFCVFYKDILFRVMYQCEIALILLILKTIRQTTFIVLHIPARHYIHGK